MKFQLKEKKESLAVARTMLGLIEIRAETAGHVPPDAMVAIKEWMLTAKGHLLVHVRIQDTTRLQHPALCLHSVRLRPGGGRQGDNLFPLLFALIVHNLKLIIDHCPAQGITIPNSNSTFKIDQYADDTKLGIGHVNDIDIYTQAIDKFCKASGMKVNWEDYCSKSLSAHG